MTAVQMSHEFDLLWNNIMSNQAPGLTEYEKSVLLTKAQDEVVKNYLVRQSQGNTLQLGAEDSAKRQIDFSNLTMVFECSTSGSSTEQHKDGVLYKLPSLVLSILSETVCIAKGETETQDLAVVPLSSDEFLRLMSKPYKYPLKGQCWRLMSQAGDVELVAPYGSTITSYKIRYVKRPHPIVISKFPAAELALVYNSLSYGWSPAGVETANSEAPETIHEDIVQRAVELAKAAWSSSGDFVALGKRTE